jgi:hypothetical protein
VIEVVTIPADLALPVRVESLPAEVAGFRRLVGGSFRAVPVGEEMAVVMRRGASARGFPVNTRAFLLAVSRDPGFAGKALHGDVVFAGRAEEGDLAAAPQWLRDMCTRPTVFEIVDITDDPGSARPMALSVPDLFYGLAIVVGISASFPNRIFRLRPTTTPNTGP